MHQKKLLNCFIALFNLLKISSLKLLNWKKQYNNITIQQFNNGFTLIELLIVISIIAILIAAATASWTNAQMKSRDGKRKADLKAVQQALELYLQTNGTYPDANNGLIRCNLALDSNLNFWGQEFICTPNQQITYMQQLPKDPAYQDLEGYYYEDTDPDDINHAYIIWTKLENLNDPEIQTGALPSQCSIPPGERNFCVVNP